MTSCGKLLFWGLLASLACAPAFGTIAFVGTSGDLGPNDFTNWSQLGGDATVLGSTFSATSNLGVGIGGAFSGDAGLVADVCPASPSCTWGSPSSTPPNFTAGDALVYAFDPNGSGGNGAGTGPISLTFSTPVFGAGAWIDADTNGTYTATIAAYNAGGLIFTSSGQTSDSSGDPLFLGVLDSTAEITEIVVTLTSCPGCGALGNDLGDFAMDTLLMTTDVPEPSSVLLLGSGLVGMAWTLRRRSRKSGRKS